jgi:hypothetical protein
MDEATASIDMATVSPGCILVVETVGGGLHGGLRNSLLTVLRLKLLLTSRVTCSRNGKGWRDSYSI